MKTAKAEESKQPAMGFTVTVDGRTYGPFPQRDREKFNYLAHKKGVQITPVQMPLSLSISLSREKRQKEIHPSLLDGIEFTPVRRRRR